MDFWFTTSHGKTRHNQPGTPDYVPGEPPEFPLVEINYREKCLQDGFARLGYPNTGDLRNSFQGRLAPDGYSLSTVNIISGSSLTKNQLLAFANIKAGDFIVIPADEGSYEVHFGMVLKKDRGTQIPYDTRREEAYYYHFDIPEGDYYECAHRVNVRWAKDADGEFAVIRVPEIGGVWRQAFGHLNAAAERLNGYAKKYGFW